MAGSPAEAKEIAATSPSQPTSSSRLIKMIIRAAGLRHHRVGHRELRRYQGGRPRRRPRHGLSSPPRSSPCRSASSSPTSSSPAPASACRCRTPRRRRGLKAASINLRVVHHPRLPDQHRVGDGDERGVADPGLLGVLRLRPQRDRPAYADPMVHMLKARRGDVQGHRRGDEGGPARGLRRHGLGRHHPGPRRADRLRQVHRRVLPRAGRAVGAADRRRRLVLGHSVVRLLRLLRTR